MKVSRRISRRASAMHWNRRGKYSSPLISSSTRLPSRQGSSWLHLHRQRQVVGQVRPGPPREDARLAPAGIAQVDAVQRQHRPARRKLRAGRPWAPTKTSRRPQPASRRSARWRQSLKSPATTTGSRSGRPATSSQSSCNWRWRCASRNPRCTQTACSGRPMSITACNRPRSSLPATETSRLRWARSDAWRARHCHGGLRDTPRCARRRTAATCCRPDTRIAAPAWDGRRAACRLWEPRTSWRNTRSAPTLRTASRNSGRMKRRLNGLKPLWVFTVSTCRRGRIMRHSPAGHRATVRAPCAGCRRVPAAAGGAGRRKVRAP